MTRAQLFIGRLPREMRRSELEDIFKRYGRVIRCDVRIGMATAYAFVDFDDHRDAEDAMKYENGRDIRGQRMVVEWAIDDEKYGRRKGNRGGRGDRGGRGGGNYRRSRSRTRSRSRSKSRSRTKSPSEKRNERRKRSRSSSRSKSRSRSYENHKNRLPGSVSRSRSRSRS